MSNNQPPLNDDAFASAEEHCATYGEYSTFREQLRMGIGAYLATTQPVVNREELDKHIQEREAEAWENGESAGNHNTVQRLRMIQMSDYEPLIGNPYEESETNNGI